MRLFYGILIVGAVCSLAATPGFIRSGSAQTPESEDPIRVQNGRSPSTLTRPAAPAVKPAPKPAPKPVPAPAPTATGNRFFQRAMKAYTNRADQKNHWKAVRHFFKLAKKFPDDRDMQIWCARTALYCALRIEHGDTRISVANQGEQCAARVMDKNPGDYDAGILMVRNRLVAKRASGMFSFYFYAGDAKDWLEPMMQAYPRRFEAYQVLGHLYVDAVREPFSFGDSAKGIALLEKGKAYAGEDAEYYYNMGVAYAEADQVPAARVSFKRCIDDGTSRVDLDWEATFFKERSKEILETLH